MDRGQSSFRISTSRVAALVAVFFFVAMAMTVHPPIAPSRLDRSSLQERSRVMENFGRLPLAFEPNHGQVKSGVDFIARGGGFEAFLDPAGATLMIGARRPQPGMPGNHQSRTKPARTELSQIRMSLVGASQAAHPQAEDRLPGVVNYYRGNDRTKWHRDVPTYRRVRYAEVYRGIDLAYYGDRGTFEFDFDLKPGADASKVALAFDGIEGAEVAADGGALLKTAKGNLTLKRPVAYQQIDGERRAVQADYKIVTPADRSKSTRITIALGNYDHSRALTIDPVLLFSTLFGGTTTEINGAAIDSNGNVYVTGFAFDCSECVPFPTTGGQLYAGDTDAFITEVRSNGSSVVYSTLIGGSGFDESKAIAVDESGDAYLAGETFSTDFPRTVGPTSAPGNGDGFVAKFGTDGSVTWATYLGGSEFDETFSIALPQGCASNCNAYIAGSTESSNFPGASGFTGQNDAFVTEMQPDGSGEVYTRLIAGNIGPTGSGSAATYATSLAVDSGGIAFVAGGTDATDFPKTVGPTLTGTTDAFVAKLNSGGTISYARLLGGSDFDQAEGVAIQPSCTEPCNAYVNGVTFSADFPTTKGALQTALTGAVAEFIAELSGDGSSTVYSTLLGTSDAPVFGVINGIAVDTAGDAYVIGGTTSDAFPLHNEVGDFPGPNGALWQFAENSSPTPTPAPTKLSWVKANGSPLIISNQEGDSSGDIVVGTTTGIFMSTDGTDFTQLSASGLPSGAVPALDFETSLTPNVIFAGVGSGVFVSTDTGSTFSATGFTNASEFIVDLAGSSLSNTDVLVGTIGNGLWSSTNGGMSFSQVASIPATATVFALASNAKNPPSQVFAGTSRGVFTVANLSRSNFPGTWTATNLTMSAVGAINADRNSSPVVDYAGTYFQGLYESTDNFTTFVRANIPQFSYSALEVDRDNSTTPSTVFAGVNALDQAYVYENPSGYGGAFTATNFANQPGSVKGLKNPYVGELLQFHPVVAELNPGGTALTFSSYLAGSSYDSAGGVAVDPTGTNIYLAGTTFSSDFPMQGSQVSSYHGFASGFIAKIGPAPSGSPTATSTASSSATPTLTGTPGRTPTPTSTATGTPAATATPTATSTPTGARISAPSTLTVKPVGIGISASSMAKFVIKNIGKSGDLIGNISLENNQGNGFKLSSSGSFDIAHGKSLPYTLTFIPDATLDTATITITSNDPTKGPIVIPLTGTGLPGQLSVPKTLTITSKGIGIEGQAPLVLKNVGKGLLNGTSTGPMPSSIFGETGGGGGGGNGIAPGKTKTLTITFTPTQTGTTPGSIEIDVTPPSTPASATVTLIGIVKGKK